MLKTRFRVHSFEEWIRAWIDFEEKLGIFKSFDDRNQVKLNNYVGEDFYEIEIIINKQI